MPKTKSPAPLAPTKHIVPYDNFGVRRGGGGSPPPPLPLGSGPGQGQPPWWGPITPSLRVLHVVIARSFVVSADVVRTSAGGARSCAVGLGAPRPPPPRSDLLLRSKGGRTDGDFVLLTFCVCLP